MYKIIRQNEEEMCVLRISDNANIPFYEENIDYKEYLEWVAEGNVAEVVEL